MHKGRLEAFSDAVIAIAMTIMVLELKPPHGGSLVALEQCVPTLALYLLSFVFIAIYWNNHHHMLQVARHVDGTVLWANMNLLFWLSLIPFATDWMGSAGATHWPVAFYGLLLLLCAISYTLLQFALIRVNGRNSKFAKALGSDLKGKVSVLLYIVAIGATWISPTTSCGLFVVVALIWLVPDKRMENAIPTDEE